jgi:hypothetical protein
MRLPCWVTSAAAVARGALGLATIVLPAHGTTRAQLLHVTTLYFCISITDVPHSVRLLSPTDRVRVRCYSTP